MGAGKPPQRPVCREAPLYERVVAGTSASNAAMAGVIAGWSYCPRSRLRLIAQSSRVMSWTKIGARCPIARISEGGAHVMTPDGVLMRRDPLLATTRSSVNMRVISRQSVTLLACPKLRLYNDPVYSCKATVARWGILWEKGQPHLLRGA